MKRECESCIKRKTTYCPNSTECMATDDMPYYQNRIMLLEENQELKLELSGYRQAILEDKDMLGLKEESEELKKQLTTYKILHRDCKVDNLKNISKIEEMENQQKEFIEYLEYQVKLQEELNDIHLATGFEEILQKYKSIIGDDK